MSSKTDFRKQVQQQIKKKKTSIAKVSRLADVHSDTLYKYLRGESEITAANLGKVLDALNTI